MALSRSLSGPYLGDEYAVLLQQFVAILAASQQLPDFSSEWLRYAAADQWGQTLGPGRQVPMPDTNTKAHIPLFWNLTSPSLPTSNMN